jgi:hypothetical protein
MVGPRPRVLLTLPLGRGLCDELITGPEESYRVWCVVVCDLETSRMRRPWPALGRSAGGGGNFKGTGWDIVGWIHMAQARYP